MLNNILNGWRRVITKIAIIIALVYVIIICIPVIFVSKFPNEYKWTCGETVEVIETLQSNGEQIVASGNISDDSIFMTFWVNDNSKEWTLLVTIPANEKSHSCIVLYGAKHRFHKPKMTI